MMIALHFGRMIYTVIEYNVVSNVFDYLLIFTR